MSAGRDYTAGTLGDNNRNVSVGRGNQQTDSRASNANYFNFGHELKDSFDEGQEEGMNELSRLIREFSNKMVLLEYRINKMENAFQWTVGIIVVGMGLIIWKLYFGG